MTPAASFDLASEGSLRAMRALALAGLTGLIVLGLAWELWLAPTGRGTLAVKVLPLVLALAGVWQQRLYTYRWLSLLVWLYFCEGVVRGVTDKGLSQHLAIIEVALTLLLFVACVRYVRWRVKSATTERGAAR